MGREGANFKSSMSYGNILKKLDKDNLQLHVLLAELRFLQNLARSNRRGGGRRKSAGSSRTGLRRTHPTPTRTLQYLATRPDSQ